MLQLEAFCFIYIGCKSIMRLVKYCFSIITQPPISRLPQPRGALIVALCFNVVSEPAILDVMISFQGPYFSCSTCYRGVQAGGPGADVHICQLCQKDVCIRVPALWRCAHGPPRSPRSKGTTWISSRYPTSPRKTGAVSSLLVLET